MGSSRMGPLTVAGAGDCKQTTTAYLVLGELDDKSPPSFEPLSKSGRLRLRCGKREILNPFSRNASQRTSRLA